MNPATGTRLQGTVKTILICICLLAAAVNFQCKRMETTTTKSTAYNYSVESALMALNIADSLQQGNAISESTWDSLYSSGGYQTYICGEGAEGKKRMIREAMNLAFDPSNSGILDSILATPIDYGNTTQLQLMVEGFARYRGKTSRIREFLQNTDFSTLLRRSDSLTKTFLPKRVREESPELFTPFFLMMDPDAYVNSCGMVVDCQLAMDVGTGELEKLFAHEYHHNYRQLSAPGYQHPLLLGIDKLHREGVADLVDKAPPPLTELMGMPKDLVEFYNREFDQTAERLRGFDSLGVALSEERISPTAYAEMTGNYFVFGGHPNGYSMALLIRDKIGLDSLISTFDDPMAFLRLYNRAASQTGGAAHVFSDAFCAFARDLAEQAGKIQDYGDEYREVTIEVTTPEGVDALYITGDHPELGAWDPQKIGLEEITPNLWRVTLSLQAPVEFKFTRGGWDTEGFIRGQIPGPNIRAGFHQDTTLVYTIEGWKDRPAD